MGHWDSGKAAGQLLSVNLARRGFVVLAYDPVGQGERQQAYDVRTGRSLIGGPTDQHFSNGAAAILMGQALSRYFIHDGMRAIDYLVSRPEVDPARIGATGCSGGGTQTTYIAALDPRVKVAAVACYMNSFQTLFAGSLGDSEQSVPGFLAAGLDQTDYVELFAPKPWLMTSTEDDFFTPAGARQVFEEAQKWYALHGAGDRVKWVVGPGGHGTPPVVRQAIYDWMTQWLGDKTATSGEEVTDLLPDHALLVTKTGQVEGRELYEIIRDTPRVKGTALELAKYVGDLIAANPAILETSQVLAPPDSSQRRPAVVIVQDDLAPGVDATALRAQGQVVAIMTMSGRGGDAERPCHRQLDEQYAGVAGRPQSAGDPCRGSQRRRRPAGAAVRCRPGPDFGARDRRRRDPGAARRRDQSTDFLGGVDAHASQRAGGDRQPDPHQPPRRGPSRVRGEVGPGRSPRSAPAASGRVA